MIRKEDCVPLGYVSKSHNLRGEVIVTTHNDLLEKYMNEPVFILLEGRPVPFFIAPDGLSARSRNSYIVKFDFVDSQQQAERLTGSELLLEAARVNKRDLESDKYDPSQWTDFLVEDKHTGQTGNVRYVSDYSGNIVLTIDIFGKEILLPFAERYILYVDFKNKKIEADIPQEIVDLY